MKPRNVSSNFREILKRLYCESQTSSFESVAHWLERPDALSRLRIVKAQYTLDWMRRHYFAISKGLSLSAKFSDVSLKPSGRKLRTMWRENALVAGTARLIHTLMRYGSIACHFSLI
jgi:hypothetical protein|tara:strand:- start:36 stop:386 length:351 start_codon:yes stop_codon:yes gene_type:complete